MQHHKKQRFKVPEKFPSPYGVSFILMLKLEKMDIQKKISNFRLLTEYHSFLSDKYEMDGYFYTEFPSPYGVSFILINRWIYRWLA